MRYVALCLFLVGISEAATRNVTVLLNFEKPHSASSMTAFRRELHDLLAPAGLAVSVMLKSEMPVSPQFSELVVFEMKGVCSMNAEASSVPFANHSSLGVAFTSDGQVLHFGAVECDRVRQCLQRVAGLRHPSEYEAAYGVALGIVVAHEIYHMMVGAKEHTKDGLTKESLSARELLNGDLTIPKVVREAMLRDGL